MASACGNFHSALGIVLPDDVGEIHIRHGVGTRVKRQVPGNTERFFLFRPSEDADNFIEIVYAADPEALELGRFQGRLIGQDASFEPRVASHLCHREPSRDGPQGSVETKLSHYQIFFHVGHYNLLGSGKHSYGYRKVVA